ncbi:PEP-CTERM sorting domain-containing protein [Phycisphaeraceae bacterium D3-23]
MKTRNRLNLTPAMLVAGLGAAMAVPASAAVFAFDSNGTDARVVTEPSGARDDNNGGNTATGALIGLNSPAAVDNFMLYDFNGLGAAAGEIVVSATVTINVATGFTNANHGGVNDLINLSEIALTNDGWVDGGGVITGADTPADDGTVSFANAVQFNGSGTTVAWQDAGGADVANLLGALTLIDSVPGYVSGGGTPTLTFNVSAAMAQSWIDNGVGGVALSTTDDGDSRSRFNFQLDAATLNVTTVPEPGSLALLGLGGLALLRRRRA